MTFLMRLCALLVNALCMPLHLLDALGFYWVYKQRFFPDCLQRFSVRYNEKMHTEKTELFAGLARFKRPGGGQQLTILEIGCGTGANFKFYPAGSKLICTDPNPHVERYLQRSVKENDQLTFAGFVVACAEDMGQVRDESVDVVVCTLVLCSVKDTRQTLREVQRILRSGGGFFFLEHVVADPSSWSYFFQHVIQPAWNYYGDGCQLNRATWEHLEAAGFSELSMRHIEAPLMSLVKHHIIGYSVK